MVYLPDQVPFDRKYFRNHVDNERHRLFDGRLPEMILGQAKKDHRAFRWSTLYVAAYPERCQGDGWKLHREIVRGFLDGEGRSLLRDSMNEVIGDLFEKEGASDRQLVGTFEKDLSVYRLMEWKRNLLGGSAD